MPTKLQPKKRTSAPMCAPVAMTRNKVSPKKVVRSASKPKKTVLDTINGFSKPQFRRIFKAASELEQGNHMSGITFDNAKLDVVIWTREFVERVLSKNPKRMLMKNIPSDYEMMENIGGMRSAPMKRILLELSLEFGAKPQIETGFVEKYISALTYHLYQGVLRMWEIQSYTEPHLKTLRLWYQMNHYDRESMEEAKQNAIETLELKKQLVDWKRQMVASGIKI